MGPKAFLMEWEDDYDAMFKGKNEILSCVTSMTHIKKDHLGKTQGE